MTTKLAKPRTNAPTENVSCESFTSLDMSFNQRRIYGAHSEAIRVSERCDIEVLSIAPELQSSTQSAVDFIKRKSFASEVSAVVMDSKGQVLSLAESTAGLGAKELPTASLFKLLTTAAALDDGYRPDTLISFHAFRERGYWDLGDRHLAKDLIDNDVMALDEALALSNNLVYAKVALSLCGGDRERAAQQLKAYADKFSISGEINGQNLPFAACGLSETYVSLVNAAALMSSIANGGLLVKPSVVQSVIDKNGELVFQRQHSGHQRVFNGAAAQEMMEMARKTTCCYGFSDLEAGTARGAFFDNFRPKLKGVSVSAKTGSISNKGQQVRWFVATPETWGRAEYGMSYPIQSGLSIAVCTLGAVVPYVAPNLGKAIIEKLLRGEGEFSLKVDQNDHFIFL